MRINKKTLATTIVLECNKEETGVGPSIAFGNQGWKKNWEDLLIIASTKKKAKNLVAKEVNEEKEIETEENTKKKMKTTYNLKSPIRL